jgi:uncharacterized membrane protein YhaH (DUF805 family)
LRVARIIAVMYRLILLATALSGALDILFAMTLTVLFGREIGNMLRTVASGPFPAAKDWGDAGAALGLIVHFALMAIMASAFLVVARRFPDILRSPLKWGVLYGLATYVVMNWIVVPLRFDAPLPPKPMAIATQLFAHIILVGIPIALVTARTLPSTLAQRAVA